MAKLTTESVIRDDVWTFVVPLLPADRRPNPAVDPRAAFAAVVHALTSGTAWGSLPAAFGVTRSAAYRRFVIWTDADLWRRLAYTAAGTLYEQWARTVASAAIKRAAGWPEVAPPIDPDAPPDTAPDEPRDKPQPRPPTAAEYGVARAAQNRPDSIAL